MVSPLPKVPKYLLFYFRRSHQSPVTSHQSQSPVTSHSYSHSHSHSHSHRHRPSVETEALGDIINSYSRNQICVLACYIVCAFLCMLVYVRDYSGHARYGIKSGSWIVDRGFKNGRMSAEPESDHPPKYSTPIIY